MATSVNRANTKLVLILLAMGVAIELLVFSRVLPQNFTLVGYVEPSGRPVQIRLDFIVVFSYLLFSSAFAIFDVTQARSLLFVAMSVLVGFTYVRIFSSVVKGGIILPPGVILGLIPINRFSIGY